ncbi:hypothetical protein RFI_31567 [Reticulomyxa filosa]|uniref:Uncharacterized protein n=1 Tax=Reticulomyxa filosa TaxID=46433 RepID=X6LV79_RETFI|nr:hypothetical protein RFI_31567 [Reticulomyxa filosa]|eukprot:ETO05828.1 hypothetical protein RFI_31567 [Reticulomyxa filosa]
MKMVSSNSLMKREGATFLSQNDLKETVIKSNLLYWISSRNVMIIVYLMKDVQLTTYWYYFITDEFKHKCPDLIEDLSCNVVKDEIAYFQWNGLNIDKNKEQLKGYIKNAELINLLSKQLKVPYEDVKANIHIIQTGNLLSIVL